jgi:hypothetical protein
VSVPNGSSFGDSTTCVSLTHLSKKNIARAQTRRRRVRTFPTRQGFAHQPRRISSQLEDLSDKRMLLRALRNVGSCKDFILDVDVEG